MAKTAIYMKVYRAKKKAEKALQAQEQQKQKTEQEQQPVLSSSLSLDNTDEKPTPKKPEENGHDSVDWNKDFAQLSQHEYNKMYHEQAKLNKGDPEIVEAKHLYSSKEHKPAELTHEGTNKYTWSQDLNHKLNQDLPLNSKDVAMKDGLMKGMHPIGKDVTLSRAAHDTLINSLLKKVGIKSYEGLTEKQLNTALVGTEFKMKSFGSWGADDSKNPFIGGGKGGGRELIIVAKTASSTKVISGAKDQMEFVTGVGQNCHVTHVELTNQYAYPKKGGAKQVVKMYVDMW